MSLLDYTKRLKKLAKDNYKVAKLEMQVSHKYVNLFKRIDGINKTLTDYDQSVQQCLNKATEMYQSVEVLKELIEKDSKVLVNLEGDVQRLQAEIIAKRNKIADERHQILMDTALLRIFKNAKNKAFQGTNKWIPFQINSADCTSPHLATWRSIILENSDEKNDSVRNHTES